MISTNLTPPGRGRCWEKHQIKMQQWLAVAALILFSVSCIAALTLFYLQGFHWGGFNLPDNLMHWLGAVTVGTLASLALIVYQALFRQK
jgi:hypothetical protein